MMNRLSFFGMTNLTQLSLMGNYNCMENAMPKSGKMTLKVVETFTSKNFGTCAKTIKVGNNKPIAINQVDKETFGEVEMSADTKAQVVAWAKCELAQREWKSRKCFSQQAKTNNTKGINRLRTLLEFLGQGKMSLVKAPKKTTTKKATAKPSVTSELAKAIESLSPEVQNAFLAMAKIQGRK